ncbi:MAG: DEAD/DEAH box helicase [Sulfolobaceae archaeon]|nr:DEAD/DEAH box helicase [Sulfolobaceae archaeon]
MSITSNKDFVRRLLELGYKELTPIQKIAIPKVLEGKNLVIIAPTGYGKTESAILPVFYKIYNERPERISALYITPLRALNRDLEDRLRKIGDKFDIRVAVRHGDTSERERKNIIKEPPDLLITTPETLQYLIVNENYKNLFRNLRWIIVDELQEMLDDKRGIELSILLERIKRITNNKPQLIGLSATISDIELAKRFLDSEGNVEVARIDATKDLEISINLAPPTEDDINKSAHSNLNPETIARLRSLAEIIKNNKPVLIFTNTRETTEFLANTLKTMYNINIVAHHGSLSREVRTSAEKDFKEGKLDALTATSSLELGIDIGSIRLVVQYMSPRQVIRLIQRVGRSGHSVHLKSRGIIVPSEDVFDILECASIVDMLKAGYLEKSLVEFKPYDVAAHEIAGLVLEKIVDKQEIYELLKRSYYFRDLTLDELENILSMLEAAKIVRRRDSKVLPYARTISYYYNVNMIPDSLRTYIVINMVDNTKIGTLDEDFVVQLEEGSVIVLGGRLWKVNSIEENKIYVEETELKAGILPSWFGESIPVEKEVAMKAYEFLERISKGERVEYLDDYSYNKIKQILNEHIARGYPLPTKNRIVIENIGGTLLIIHAPFGTRGNNTLGALISSILSRIKGIKTSYRADAYHIAISSVLPVSKTDIENIIKSLLSSEESTLIEYLKISIKESPQFKWSILIEAERFGAIEPKSDITITSTLLKAYYDTIIGEEAVRELMTKDYDIEIFKDLKKVTWNVIDVPSISPLAKMFLDKILLLRKDSAETPVLIEVFKRRLMESQVRVVCILCGWNGVFKAKDVPIKCPNCGSVFLTVLNKDDTEGMEIIKKALKGMKLSKAEKKVLEDLKLIADYYSSNNKYVAIGLSVRGVGPHNIGKALSRLRDGENSFYEALLDEERRFLKYRKFWQ